MLIDCKQKYRKYKAKYLKLKCGERSEFGQKEKIFIKNNFRFLVHFTTYDTLKQIIKDMQIKSESLTNKNRNLEKYPWIWTDYIVFVNLVEKKSCINSYWTIPSNCYDMNSYRNIGIIIDINIMFDKEIYYFYSPDEEHGDYGKESIPNPNLRHLLSQQNRTKYIDSLIINDNLENELLEYSFTWFTIVEVINKEEERYNTFDNDYKIGKMPEFCIFDRIDLNKYIVGIFVVGRENDYNLNNIVPKNIKIYTESEANILFTN